MLNLKTLLTMLTVVLMVGNMEAANFKGQSTDIGGFVAEHTMKADLLQMLADFTTYIKNDYQACAEPNKIGEACGCFRGENTMGSDERGVRPNADLSMVCAFLVKYGRNHVVLPNGVTWADLETMAMRSLVFAYSTHKANKLKVCKGGRYWGSTSASDYSWESSLWAMSVAYSAFFQWGSLTEEQRIYVYQLLKAECNYELERTIPTGYEGDTKAEENGWEADVLAVTLGLFPDDDLAPQWYERLRLFAVNSYSHINDSEDNTVVDPDRDQTTVKDLYRGQNLYDDYTLQNHNYFHTSYQNVVIQELGEAALALKLFQQSLHGHERWATNALMHHNDKVMKEVLYWLALSDGELAMPNGNDWSLFLYDQLTSYSTNACFLRDSDALMLENRAYQMIKARQQTTTDGSWLLRPDVGARRMGVEAHRVMMTWLMHELFSTASMEPSTWDDFNRRYSRAKVFSSQNIIRASTPERFTCFSWSKGLKSYTGYIAPHQSKLYPERSNLIVPFKANNTGNLLGWYEVQGRRTNAKPVVEGVSQLQGSGWVMNGQLLCNDDALDHRFAIYSTPGNVVVYHDLVTAVADTVIVKKECGGLLAISMDELTTQKRTFYFQCEGQKAPAYDSVMVDGKTRTTLHTSFLNIDQTFGVVAGHSSTMGFGDLKNNNSVMTARLYSSYADSPRTFLKGQTVGRRSLGYYSNVTAQQTSLLANRCFEVAASNGWAATLVADTDGSLYLLVSNFAGSEQGSINGTVLGRQLAMEVTLPQNHSATFKVEQKKRRLRVSPMKN